MYAHSRHVTKTIMLGDAEQCSDFDLMPKCKNCTQFTADTETVEMGVCQAQTSASRDEFSVEVYASAIW